VEKRGGSVVTIARTFPSLSASRSCVQREAILNTQKTFSSALLRTMIGGTPFIADLIGFSPVMVSVDAELVAIWQSGTAR